MKISFECEVESKTHIETTITVERRDKTYVFHPNEAGLFCRIQVLFAPTDPTRFYQGSDPNKHNQASREVTDLLMDDVRELESVLAVAYNVKRINWNDPTVRLIRETEDDERNKASISRIYGLPTYKDAVTPANQASLEGVINAKASLSHLAVPISFYREALNEYHSHKYINAFINCYFVLEGFYANKQHNENKVITEFKNSTELMHSVNWAIKNLIYPQPEIHGRLLIMLKIRNKEMVTSDTLIELIVKTRNELLHFQNNPNKIQGTPFSHGKFQSISYVAISLALRTILHKIEAAGYRLHNAPYES